MVRTTPASPSLTPCSVPSKMSTLAHTTTLWYVIKNHFTSPIFGFYRERKTTSSCVASSPSGQASKERHIANGIFCLVNFCKFSSHRFSSLDACHLSGTYGGTLHSTLLIDPSGNLFPLGFSIESGNECVASWTYHLRSLKCILPPPFFFRLTIVSDRKKGLESVIQEELPDSLKRHCLQHLAESVKASCGGRQAAAQLRLLAKLQEPAEFLDAFQQSAESLVDYLQEVGEYSLWNMAHALGPLYGHLSSNASESLNALLLPSRCLNVIGIVEGIRCKVAAFTSVRRLMYSGLDASQPTDGDVKNTPSEQHLCRATICIAPSGRLLGSEEWERPRCCQRTRWWMGMHMQGPFLDWCTL